MDLPLQKKTLRRLGAEANERVASRPSAFARAHLERLGWSEGDGLGRNRDGIATHIRVTKKDDTKGIGCSEREQGQFDNTWWSSGFDVALQRIKVPESVAAGAADSDSDSSSSSSSSSSAGGSSSEDAAGKRAKRRGAVAKQSKQPKREERRQHSRADSDSDSNDSNDSNDSDLDAAAKVSLARDLSFYSEEDRKLFIACGGRRCGKRAGMLQTGKMLREQEADRAFRAKFEEVKAAKGAKAAVEQFHKVAQETVLNVTSSDSDAAAEAGRKQRNSTAARDGRKEGKHRRRGEAEAAAEAESVAEAADNGADEQEAERRRKAAKKQARRLGGKESEAAVAATDKQERRQQREADTSAPAAQLEAVEALQEDAAGLSAAMSSKFDSKKRKRQEEEQGQDQEQEQGQEQERETAEARAARKAAKRAAKAAARSTAEEEAGASVQSY